MYTYECPVKENKKYFTIKDTLNINWVKYRIFITHIKCIWKVKKYANMHKMNKNTIILVL